LVPVCSIRGSNDGLASAEQAQEWRKATSSEFSFIEFAGDQMYLVDRAQEVLDLIEATSAGGRYRGSAVTGGLRPIRQSSVGCAVP
jgi:surfactin synthase thioesterase subunit